MKSFRINGVEIPQENITVYILQNRKLEAVKFICEKAHIDLSSSKRIVELIQENPIEHIEKQDLYELVRVKDENVKNESLFKKDAPLRFGVILFIGGILIFLLGYFYFLNSKTSDIEDELNCVDLASVEDLYPVDTNRIMPEFKADEIRIIENAHFEKLKVADNPPLDEDAQAAVIRLTQGRLADVIIDQKLNLAIGKCYENTNTEGNFRCVSCMVILYNRNTNVWQEAPYGDNFLKNAYDFYQPSEGMEWEAKDLSMRIPYDYDLRNRFKYE